MTLNDDCWLLVFDHLLGDFQTLARLLRVSRQMLRLAAPCLYNQLNHPENRKQIANWSRKAHARLSSLLLTSCGILPPSVDGLLWTFEVNQLSTMLPMYDVPLAYNYFDCLRRLPIDILWGDLWDEVLESFHERLCEKRSAVSFEGTLTQVARVVTEVRVSSLKVLKWWSLEVDNLSQLSKLTVNITKDSYKDTESELLKFVSRHKEAFPGQLTEIHVMSPTSLSLPVNCLVAPTKLYIKIFQDMVELNEDQNHQIFNRLEEIVLDNCIYSLQHEGSPAPTLALAQFLQQCRLLRTIKISRDKRNEHSDNLSRLFSWAPQEFKGLVDAQAQENHNGSLSVSSQPPLFVRDSTSLRPLVQLEEFVGVNLEEDMALDVISGFRQSLKKLDFTFHGVTHALNVQWSWRMTCLRVLKIKTSNTDIHMSKLQLCPVLEELSLENVGFRNHLFGEQELNGWQLPKSLRTLRMKESPVLEHLNLESLGRLKKLESLEIHQSDMEVFVDMDSTFMLNWNFPSLKTLTLGGDALEFWHRVFLRASPNLQSFSSPNESVFDSTKWWFETGQQSFEAEAVWEENDHDDMAQRWLKELQDKQPNGWNVHHTKIKSLIFSRDWRIDEALEPLLKNSQMLPITDSVFLPTTTTETPMSGISIKRQFISITTQTMYGGMAFPELSYVEFSALNTRRTYDRWGTGSMDNLFKTLMERPKMRQIKSMWHNPTLQFIEQHLEVVDKESVLRLVKKYDFGGNAYNVAVYYNSDSDYEYYADVRSYKDSAKGRTENGKQLEKLIKLDDDEDNGNGGGRLSQGSNRRCILHCTSRCFQLRR